MTKDQPNSLEQHRVAMKEALEAGGAQAVIAYVGAFDSDPLRRVLYIASRQVLVGTSRRSDHRSGDGWRRGG